MAMPPFTFRLPSADRKNLLRVAKLTGLSPGGLVAQMVGAICSGDLARMEKFNGDLVRAINGQLSLSLERTLVAKPKRKGGAPP